MVANDCNQSCRITDQTNGRVGRRDGFRDAMRRVAKLNWFASLPSCKKKRSGVMLALGPSDDKTGQARHTPENCIPPSIPILLYCNSIQNLFLMVHSTSFYIPNSIPILFYLLIYSF